MKSVKKSIVEMKIENKMVNEQFNSISYIFN